MIVDFAIGENWQAVDIYQALGSRSVTTPAQTYQTQQAYQEYQEQKAAEEEYGAFDWFVKCIKNYANFRGRARRKEYWIFSFIANLLVYTPLIISISLADEELMLLTTTSSTILLFFLLIPALAVRTRRLHDTGKSGWWQLLAVVPLIGFLVLLVLLATEGDQTDNRYGPPPK